MKTSILILAAALGLAAQTTTVTPTFVLNSNALSDLYMWNRGVPGVVTGQFAAFTLTLASPISATDTALTLTGTVTGLGSTGTVVIDSEAIPYTALSGQTLTIARSGAQGTVTATHAAGATVNVEKYPTVGSMLFALLSPGLLQVASGLGVNSQLLGAALTAQQTANAAAAAAVANANLGSGQ